MARSRPLAFAWVIGLVAVLVQSLVGGCAPHPPAPEELPPVTVPAGALGERSEQVHPPLALTATDGTQLRLVSIRADAVIELPLAFTELHLVFENLEDRVIEGRFRIELPPQAAISRFAMKIGGGWQEGEVVERQAARVAYEDFLHRGQDPALLEHEAGNTFSARVFPIAAGERKEIIVSFSQELASAGEPYRLGLRGLPELESFTAKVIRREHDDTGVRVRTVESNEQHWTPQDDLVVESLEVDGAIALRNGNLVVARVSPEGEQAPREMGDLTVLFDTSASRALGFDTRIHRLADLVAALATREEFRLRVFAFDQRTAPIYDGTASGFGRDALEAIAAGRALGASDLVGALGSVAADPDRTDRVIVVTDGIITAGGTELADLQAVATRLGIAGVDRIDVLLDGGSRDEVGVRALTTTALPETGVVVAADRPIAEIVGKLSRTTLPPIPVTVPHARWVWPRVLEGVQAGDQVLVYADLPPEAAMVVQLGNRKGIAPLEIPGERPLLERAWVRANIERLQAERSLLLPTYSAKRTVLEHDIVALSTEYRVLSELTAMLVLESEADYFSYGIYRRGLADILTVGEQGTTVLRRAAPSVPTRASTGSRPTQILGGHAPTTGGAFAVGNDDDDVWGGLTGTEIGEAYGITGLGLVGTGRGGGAIIGVGDASTRHGDAGGRGIRVPRVRASKPIVKGALDKSVVRRIIRAHLNEIRYCYNQGLVRDPTLEGAVTVQFAIGPTGHVPVAVVSSTTLGDDAVAQCAARAVKRWKFPKPRGGSNVIVDAPFTLAPTEGSPSTWLFVPPAERELPPTVAAPMPAPAPVAPEPADGSFAQVMTALAEGRHGDALELTLAWRETDAGNVLALVALGEVAEALGDRATAARAYGSIIDLHPARADLRRYAGARLERLGQSELDLAIDTYEKAVASRPDHPSSHRAHAYALLKAGLPDEAFAALDKALGPSQIRWERFPSVREILEQDLRIVGTAWISKSPHERAAIVALLDRRELGPAKSPSTRFVLTWETDANDVDFHIEDAQGGHASYLQRTLPSGGALSDDVVTGYGPECFAIDGEPAAGPYRLWAHYFNRGAMGFGMGKLQIVVHDGNGDVRVEDRPFVILESGGRVELGTYTPPEAARLDAGGPASAR